MIRYRVFGGVLASDLPFPELPRDRSGDDPAWMLLRQAPGRGAGEDRSARLVGEDRSARLLGEERSARLLGEEQVVPGVHVRLFRRRSDHLLAFDDTGRFLLSRGGARILWQPPPSVDEEAARLDVLGRVLPLALHLEGLLVLHASAVSLCGGALAFLAPKGFGKSSLAAALWRSGAGFLTDDALPVSTGPTARVPGGVPFLRATEEVLRAAGVPAHLARGTRGRKCRVSAVRVEAPTEPGRSSEGPEASVPFAPRPHGGLPLAAIYLLAPVEPGPDRAPAAAGTALRGPAAAVTLLGQLKLGRLLSGRAAPELLRRATGLAARVPIHRLEVMRDLERLTEVVDFLLDRHAAGPVAGDGVPTDGAGGAGALLHQLPARPGRG